MGYKPSRTVQVITTDYTVEDLPSFLLVDATAGNITITLPLVLGLHIERTIDIKRKDASANTVTIVPASGDTVESAPLVLLVQGRNYSLAPDGGTNWWIF